MDPFGFWGVYAPRPQKTNTKKTEVESEDSPCTSHVQGVMDPFGFWGVYNLARVRK